MFLPHDAEEIMKIKVPTNGTKDTIACHYEKKWEFTVKSAYKLDENLKNEQPSANSKAPNGERKMWRSIWKLQFRTKYVSSVGVWPTTTFQHKK
jgi:hypothetical protein